MSFRALLFLSIVTAVVAAAFLETSLDFLAERAEAHVRSRLADDLDRHGDAVESQVRSLIDSPALAENAVIRTPLRRATGYRLSHNGETRFDGAPGMDRSEPGWIVEERDLGEGYLLTVGIEASLAEIFITSELPVDIVDLPLFLLLGLLVAWALGKVVLRPVRALTAASEQLASQRFPEPMRVPPGNDELTKMARSFNTMTAALHGYLERERTFTRYASHELRTPLSAFRAQVERAQLGLAPPEKVWPVLERNIGRMEAVLGALLDMARSGEHERVEAPVTEILEEVASALPEPLRPRVETRCAAGARAVVHDRRLAGQAIGNLLDNALRYSDGPVLLTARAGADSVTISVRDAGTGVAPNDLARIREPFYRAARNIPGLGLGLALAESVARTLGGQLELRNLEPGFEATLTLPLAPGRTRMEPAAATAAADSK